MSFEGLGQVHHLGETKARTNPIGESLPIVGLSIGSEDPRAPVLGLFGGVHGLERIGAQVCLSLLTTLAELALWDSVMQQALQKIRIVAIPLINPLGMLHLQRANPNGVDLMRNAPIEAIGKVHWLLGGHRISPRLPWYRGGLDSSAPDGSSLEPENKAVLEFCRSHFFQSQTVMTLDFHSGFGLQDQIWFPYAKTTEAFPHLAEMHALTSIFERTHPHHFYKIEPQAKNYTTNGDLWDYIYDLYREQNAGVYLPLAVEMGSWMWVRKNPWQMFSALGPFNPIKPHRQKRILRRHNSLMDFLIRAVASPDRWSRLSLEQRNKNLSLATELWYSP